MSQIEEYIKLNRELHLLWCRLMLLRLAVDRAKICCMLVALVAAVPGAVVSFRADAWPLGLCLLTSALLLLDHTADHVTQRAERHQLLELVSENQSILLDTLCVCQEGAPDVWRQACELTSVEKLDLEPLQNALSWLPIWIREKHEAELKSLAADYDAHSQVGLHLRRRETTAERVDQSGTPLTGPPPPELVN